MRLKVTAFINGQRNTFTISDDEVDNFIVRKIEETYVVHEPKKITFTAKVED